MKGIFGHQPPSYSQKHTNSTEREHPPRRRRQWRSFLRRHCLSPPADLSLSSLEHIDQANPIGARGRCVRRTQPASVSTPRRCAVESAFNACLLPSSSLALTVRTFITFPPVGRARLFHHLLNFRRRKDPKDTIPVEDERLFCQNSLCRLLILHHNCGYRR